MRARWAVTRHDILSLTAGLVYVSQLDAFLQIRPVWPVSFPTWRCALVIKGGMRALSDTLETRSKLSVACYKNDHENTYNHQLYPTFDG